MADKISENGGLEAGKVTPEQLVEAIKLVGEFAKNDPKGALEIVRASIAIRQGNDTTST